MLNSKKESGDRVQEFLYADINKKQASLATAIEGERQKIHTQEKRLEGKGIFLSEKITEEKAKGGVYCKRFMDLTELYKFEKQLKKAPKVTDEDDLMMESSNEFTH